MVVEMNRGVAEQVLSTIEVYYTLKEQVLSTKLVGNVKPP